MAWCRHDISYRFIYNMHTRWLLGVENRIGSTYLWSCLTFIWAYWIWTYVHIILVGGVWVSTECLRNVAYRQNNRLPPKHTHTHIHPSLLGINDGRSCARGRPISQAKYSVLRGHSKSVLRRAASTNMHIAGEKRCAIQCIMNYESCGSACLIIITC